jgi:hypothetical protein
MPYYVMMLRAVFEMYKFSGIAGARLTPLEAPFIGFDSASLLAA